MAAPKPEYIVETCLIKDAQEVLDRLGSDYDLIGQSTHQVGSGFGAHLEAMLTFRLKTPHQAPSGNGNGQRRKMFTPIPPKKMVDTAKAVARAN